MFNFKLFLSTLVSYVFFLVCLSYTWVLALHTDDEYKSTTVTMAVLGTSIIITYLIILVWSIYQNDDDIFLHATMITSINLVVWDLISIVIVSSMSYRDNDLQRYQLLIIWGNCLTLFLSMITTIILYQFYKSIKPGELPPKGGIKHISEDSDEEVTNEKSSLILTKNSSTQ